MGLLSCVVVGARAARKQAHVRPALLCLVAILGVLLAGAAYYGWHARHLFVSVTWVAADVETTPVPSRSADDPAIWIHPTDPALSVIMGTDKSAEGGLYVYDLAGKGLQFVRAGGVNNVDLRYDFPLGEARIDLVAATNLSSRSIALFAVDPASRTLTDVAARQIVSAALLAGCCMYRSAKTGKYYFFGNSVGGEVEQWELFDNGSGKVDAKLVRRFAVGSRTEGCVADDELGFFYISEEQVGIWRYGAEPDAGEERRVVDRVGTRLFGDIEGLAIYHGANGDGYLIASSQGSSWFSVYRRGSNNEYVTRFQISANDGRVKATDGIDVVNVGLGPQFPNGLFVAHDGTRRDKTNFKLVSWERIAKATDPPLLIDTSHDPRKRR